jgi:Holliday junction resolvase-like predicted endonuclease
MSSPTSTGRLAETAASTHLQASGHIILDRNWRNRWCEIDIVTRHAGAVHFTEVKYRARPFWGTGFEYITRDKTARLQRAALAWCQAHGYHGPHQIDVASVSGDLAEPTIEVLENALSF